MIDAYTKEKWIKDNHLENSFIPATKLYYCRPCIPEKEMVGTADNGDIIYFEENVKSLENRRFFNEKQPTGWNLLYVDKNGNSPQRVTMAYTETVKIDYFDGYSIKTIEKYIDDNPRLYLDKNKKRFKRSFYVSAEEVILIKELLKKLRAKEKNEKSL